MPTATKSFSQIQKAWQALQSLDAKSKYKGMSAIANDVCQAYQQTETTPEQLQFYIEILKQLNKVQSKPRFKVVLSKIISRWLEITGNADVEIIKKQNGKILGESVTLVIGCPLFFKRNSTLPYIKTELLSLLNAGQGYIFHPDGSGEYAIQIRIVNALEPVLTAKEFKCVLNSTETAIIDLPTGSVSVSDLGALDDPSMHSTITLEPGHYKICVYHFCIPKKINSYYIVLCQTQDEAQNHFTDLPECD